MSSLAFDVLNSGTTSISTVAHYLTVTIIISASADRRFILKSIYIKITSVSNFPSIVIINDDVSLKI